MTFWRAVRAVTRWEFNRYIKWRQQVVGVIMTFVVFGAVMIVPRLNDEEDDARAMALIGTGVLPIERVTNDDFTFTPHPHTSEAQLRQQVKDGDLAGLLIVRDVVPRRARVAQACAMER